MTPRCRYITREFWRLANDLLRHGLGRRDRRRLRLLHSMLPKPFAKTTAKFQQALAICEKHIQCMGEDWSSPFSSYEVRPASTPEAFIRASRNAGTRPELIEAMEKERREWVGR